MVDLSSPFKLKSLELKNRIVMPPMCQYSVMNKDGKPNEWHYVHYVSRAVGGTGLIIMEMTDVEPDGRITDNDLGLWSDDHIPAFARIISEVKKYGAKIGIQIAHAGRKAQDAKVPVGPSDIPVGGVHDVGAKPSRYKVPRPLTTDEVKAMVIKFQDAARRAVQAGVDTIEIHGAHGYLIHQFHSPAINNRKDEYGQDLSKFGVEVIQAMKSVIPADMPLMMRISAVEYIDDGYDLEHSIEISKKYKEAGVDIFHVSTGGEGPPGQRKPGNYPGYQVPMARAFKQTFDIPIIAVGMLDDPVLAGFVLASGDADLVAVARGMLKDPYWAVHALDALSNQGNEAAPKQYQIAYK
ncbi:NADH:flavin oxidoreductase/NADH oxidase [Paenibacillus sediminis]|uniref:2,4-dienoyl-CoA reductase-like NADH-dependent reductase (Old Yellow Enzyme family) n=1 Tax=Paenibacillus sediminis TaxID=664909 RepID=A0ABS4H0B4_9BACL|nr:NADH:flavin oxidoreductase/NADH oxidase [Paenibacillus sediminis]MBP1935973.1 2,4-dienoyl-CoA reductase-like NADH-dependent reductase (Old Yellow Enzyme family) [Paenibacillus sediminis]